MGSHPVRRAQPRGPLDRSVGGPATGPWMDRGGPLDRSRRGPAAGPWIDHGGPLDRSWGGPAAGPWMGHGGPLDRFWGGPSCWALDRSWRGPGRWPLYLGPEGRRLGPAQVVLLCRGVHSGAFLLPHSHVGLTSDRRGLPRGPQAGCCRPGPLLAQRLHRSC